MKSEQIIAMVQERLAASAGFFNLQAGSARIECQAVGCAEEVTYRADWDGDRWWVSLVTPDRWLSESIEADLMHTGDDVEDLLEDELVDLGFSGRPSVEHFRSDDLLYTFRSAVEVGDVATEDGLADRIVVWLSAYDACFRELGDVAQSAGGE